MGDHCTGRIQAMNRRGLLAFLLALVLGVTLAATPGSTAGDKDKKLPDEVVKILESADKLEIGSVDPGDGKGEAKPLGMTTVKDAGKRKEVLTALYKSVAENAQPAKCFEPRHTLKASSRGKTVEMVICFACSQMRLTVSANGKTDVTTVVHGNSAEPLLNQILKDAGIPLAK